MFLKESGGEPLMQDRFAVKLFTAVKAMGVHTALDTNGLLGSRLSQEELQHVDLVLLDIKSWDAQRHKQITGQPIGPVLEFAKRLAASKRPVWLRYVLVPGLTDKIEDIPSLLSLRAAWVTWSESTSNRFIRWADSNGRN